MLKKKRVIFYFALIFILLSIFAFLLTKIDFCKKEIFASTEIERINYLESFGWEVERGSSEKMEITIPLNFNKTYEDYNKIQLSQGFDLIEYAGKKVECFIYNITNYPNYSDDIRANLLIYDGKIIGGNIYSIFRPGFSHKLSKNIQK